MKDLPIIYHGKSPSPEHAKTVAQGLQEMIRILNKLPTEAILPVLNSTIVSTCMAQEDPIDAFATLFANASAAIQELINQPPAGTA